jgi:hypothetical protein
LDTLKGLAEKRHRPRDVLLGTGAVLLLWALAYFVVGFTFNVQHVCEVIIGVVTPTWILIRASQYPVQDTPASVIQP